eukprot:1161886-Pelagomonas_calceolata.AAC.10
MQVCPARCPQLWLVSSQLACESTMACEFTTVACEFTTVAWGSHSALIAPKVGVSKGPTYPPPHHTVLLSLLPCEGTSSLRGRNHSSVSLQGGLKHPFGCYDPGVPKNCMSMSKAAAQLQCMECLRIA